VLLFKKFTILVDVAFADVVPVVDVPVGAVPVVVPTTDVAPVVDVAVIVPAVVSVELV